MGSDIGIAIRLERITGRTAAGVLDFPFYLPTTLGTFAYDEDFAHIDYETIGGDQLSAPAGGSGEAKRLKDLGLDTLTLDWDAPWLAAKGIDQDYFQNTLLKLGRSRTPFTLIAVLDWTEELRINATLRGVHKELRHGEKDTRYWTLSLKEWNLSEVERRGAGSSGAAASVGVGGRSLPTTADVSNKTSYNTLADYFYGSATPKNAKAIRAANSFGTNWGLGTPLVFSPRWHVGDKVAIPRRPT